VDFTLAKSATLLALCAVVQTWRSKVGFPFFKSPLSWLYSFIITHHHWLKQQYAHIFAALQIIW